MIPVGRSGVNLGSAGPNRKHGTIHHRPWRRLTRNMRIEKERYRGPDGGLVEHDLSTAGTGLQRKK
jgi:hypothetical protein